MVVKNILNLSIGCFAIASSEWSVKARKAQMKTLLQKHGVSKLTELPITDYFAFQKEVEAIE